MLIYVLLRTENDDMYIYYLKTPDALEPARLDLLWEALRPLLHAGDDPPRAYGILRTEYIYYTYYGVWSVHCRSLDGSFLSRRRRSTVKEEAQCQRLLAESWAVITPR